MQNQAGWWVTGLVGLAMLAGGCVISLQPVKPMAATAIRSVEVRLSEDLDTDQRQELVSLDIPQAMQSALSASFPSNGQQRLFVTIERYKNGYFGVGRIIVRGDVVNRSGKIVRTVRATSETAEGEYGSSAVDKATYIAQNAVNALVADL